MSTKMMKYLIPLVRFGHSALWDHLHSVHFVVGQVCHLVASSKATLGRERGRHTKRMIVNKRSRLKTCSSHKYHGGGWSRGQRNQLLHINHAGREVSVSKS